MLLADTSVWIDHFRRGNAALADALESGMVVTHPFVIGELALGSLRRRSAILDDLKRLPQAIEAGNDEVLALVERRRLAGAGIGWLDAHLLASALLSGARLWTLDRSLTSAWLRVSGGRE